MKLNIQEIRKSSLKATYEQALDLTSDLRARNQESFNVKDILAVGRSIRTMYFLGINLSYTIVLASSVVWSRLSSQGRSSDEEVFMSATNQLVESS